MTDEELIARLRKFGELWPDDAVAADSIEALVKERDEALEWLSASQGYIADAVYALDKQEEAEARAERLEAALRAAHDTLWEINPNNYDHDEVCRLNDACVEVILGIAPLIGEMHGKSPEWWEDRATPDLQRIGTGLYETQPAPAEDAKAKGETDGQVLERLGMDGAKWAAEFRTTALRLGYSDMDEGWLIGWFCNAIMAGYDRKPAPEPVATTIAKEEQK